MKRGYVFTYFILGALFINSCDTSSSNDISAEPFEFLVNAEFNRTITQQSLELIWFAAGQPDATQYITYDVDLYRVVYKTVDGEGNSVKASGAIMVPRGIDNPGFLSVQHATIFSNNEAPSVDVGISVAARKAIFASAGYITFLPDYLGYGTTSEMLHPYQQESTLASASYDMIRAGLEFVESRELANTSQPVNLTGYSEGAYATLALARLIETTNSAVQIGLISMGAPIFDLTGTMDYIIDNITEPVECVACYAYFLYTYHQVYDLPRPLSDYFSSPYDQIISDGLFSGIYSSNHVQEQLPGTGDELFTESFIVRYLNGEEQQLLTAVSENNILYVPDAPVLLVHGDKDGVAPVFNSDDFETRAQSAGKNDLIYILAEGVTHGTGIFPWGLETLESLGVNTKFLAGRQAIGM